MTAEPHPIAERFFRAIEQRDFDALLDDLYAPDARIWHNADNFPETPQQNVASIKSVGAFVKDWTYDLTRRIDFEGGFVQQFVTNLLLRNGQRHRLFVCGIFQIEDGKIKRLEEYYDALGLQGVLSSMRESNAAGGSLADRIEIEDAICAVTLWSDLKDNDRAASYYTDDATLDYSSMFGPASSKLLVKDFWRDVNEFLPGFDATLHQVTNFSVDVQGDTAIAHSLVTAHHRVGEERHGNGGAYIHHFVRTTAGWRIKHQVYNVMYLDPGDPPLIDKARARITAMKKGKS